VSSVFCMVSSVFCMVSSVFCMVSSVFCMVSSVFSVCYCSTVSLKYKLCWSALRSKVCDLFKDTTSIRSQEIPVQALTIPGGSGSHILENRQIKGHSAAGRIMSLKNYNDPQSGIEPATFRLTAHAPPLPAYQAYRVE